MAFACKLCIIGKGLKGSEIDELPQTEEEFFEHLRRVHGIEVGSRSQERRVSAMNEDNADE